MNFSKAYRRYKRVVDRRLARVGASRRPRSVYEPIRYILQGGGKRVRPVLMLLACEAVGGRAIDAIDAAAAIEVLHGFTLVHDDIMDDATTRRGLQAVHKKWNQNTAILAGDEMVALAYELLLRTNHPRAGQILGTFTRAFTSVCEGQALDEEFERRREITIGHYLKMIDKKTAAMIGAATAIGGVIGGARPREVRALQEYGMHVGRAFQIQDDLLDLVADSRSLGKAVGGDLRQGKKTYLLIRGMQRSSGAERELLEKAVRRRGVSGADIRRIRKMFERVGVFDDARRLVRRNTRSALQAVERLGPPAGAAAQRARRMLEWLANALLERTF